jgi:metal-responsive CopG/Arc/MetJ family transcriptional regulator
MAHAMVQAIDDYGNAHRMNRSEVVRAAVEAYFAAQGWDPVHA